MGAIAQYLNPAHWADAGGAFWIGVVQILLIDILLSGDNAMVIALACRGLPERQRTWGIVIGASLAVLLRIVLAGVVTQLVQLPYLKLVGGLALLYIAAQLLAPEDGDTEVEPASHLWGAVRIIVVADVVMSVDNVLPVAAAARGNFALLVIGLAGSIPLLVVGAAVILSLLRRFPILVWAGAALLGWIAGEMIATDPVIASRLAVYLDETVVEYAATGAAVIGAVAVIVAGTFLRRHQKVSH